VAIAHVAGFVALPIAMIFIARRLNLQERYVPFVIVTNWVSVLGLMVLSLPAFLMLLGWATAPIASLFTIAFAVVIIRLHWFATTVTLGVSKSLAAAIVGLGLGLNFAIGSALHSLVG
jgi:hypothetical protein